MESFEFEVKSELGKYVWLMKPSEVSGRELFRDEFKVTTDLLESYNFSDYILVSYTNSLLLLRSVSGETESFERYLQSIHLFVKVFFDKLVV